jgi:hypothetical protein
LKITKNDERQIVFEISPNILLAPLPEVDLLKKSSCLAAATV